MSICEDSASSIAVLNNVQHRLNSIVRIACIWRRAMSGRRGERKCCLRRVCIRITRDVIEFDDGKLDFIDTIRKTPARDLGRPAEEQILAVCSAV